MRRLAFEEPDHFLKGGRELLADDGDPGVQRYLAAALSRHPGILDHIVNPAEATRLQAVALFRRLLEADLSLDIKLARKLPNRTGSNHEEAYTGLRAARALDVLDETSHGRRLVPILGHLIYSSDPRTCAQATLLIGRRIQNPLWSARQLQTSDDRVRASAVEALWGVNSEHAIRLLQNCVDDPCSRVAGNSLVGLHMAGEAGILARLAELSIHARPNFRSTAAWAMGRVGDAAFTPLLNLLIKDRDPVVRSTALRSLIEIRKATTRPIEDIAKQAVEISLSPEITSEEFAVVVEVSGSAEFPKFDLKLDGSSFASGRG